jgi:translation initiation factor 4G
MSSKDNKGSKIKLDINSNSYIPKNINSKTYFPKKNNNVNNNSVNNNNYVNTNSDSNLITQLKDLIDKSKPFIPKSLQNQTKQQPQQPKQVKEYFIEDITPSSNNNIKFDFDYMLSFEKWKISNETKLLSKEVLAHLERFNTVEEEAPKFYNKSNKKKDFHKNEKFKKKEENNTDDIKEWGKKDYSKEIEIAAKYKKSIEELRKKDPLKFDLTELLNILAVDNYDETSKLIYDKIKDEVEYQEKFLDVLFTKAVNENSFVSLYAKLCKEFDNKLPQRVEKTEKNKDKKPTSQMRTKLLDKCKGIFKIENNEKFDFIKDDDPNEREIKLKKFILGNVNFIGELINYQVLSKKIVFNCIKNLFQRFEKSSSDELLRLINLEAIVILMDKFGTLLKKSEKKIKTDILNDFYKQMNEILDKLNEVKESNLPGYVKYKIINLIERKNNNWEESEFSKFQKAKGREEVRKEYEQKTSHNIEGEAIPYEQDIVNDKIGKDLIKFKDFIEDQDNNGKRHNKIENYDWAIVEDIYDVHKNSLSDILNAFIDSCIDFVQNTQNLDYSKSYFNILIDYYKNSIKKNEKKKLIDKVLHLLRVARDSSLDCSYLIDVWANILSTLLKSNIMKIEDCNNLEDLEDEELLTIFSIIKKVNVQKKSLEKLNLIKNKQELFDKAK